MRLSKRHRWLRRLALGLAVAAVAAPSAQAITPIGAPEFPTWTVGWDQPPQAAPEPEEKPKPKPKPKPKVVAKPPPAEEPPRASVTVRPSQQQFPDPPPQQRQQPAAGGWPGSPQSQGQVAWPDPPSR